LFERESIVRLGYGSFGAARLLLVGSGEVAVEVLVGEVVEVVLVLGGESPWKLR
jgi:hypothetical protein